MAWMAGAVFAAAVGYAAWSAMTPAEPQLNMVVVLWDTVRADRMSVYGHTVETTPHLEAWAQNATVYDRAIAPGMWTLTTHGAMFTGNPPSHNGIKATWKWLDHRFETYTEWLQQQDYDTFAFSANAFISQDTNLTQGFDIIVPAFRGPWRTESARATRRKIIRNDMSTEISPLRIPEEDESDPAGFAFTKDAAPIGVTAFLQWMDSRETERPFLAYLNFMEAHAPRIPSMSSRKKVMSEELIDVALQTDVSQLRMLAYNFGEVEYTDIEWEAIRGTYDATLRDLDRATDRLFRELDARGMAENTIIVVTSDHGENLGENHLFGHKFAVSEPLLHVPLLIKAPGLDPGRVKEAVSTMDLFPTLLELANVPPAPHTAIAKSFADGPREDAVVSEMIEPTPLSIKRVHDRYGIDDMSRWLRTATSYEQAGDKLVAWSDDSAQLFRPQDDPGETVDLADQSTDRVQTLSIGMEGWKRSFPPYDKSLRTPKDSPVRYSAAMRNLLETLGYMEAE